jgi:hypothetical protein
MGKTLLRGRDGRAAADAHGLASASGRFRGFKPEAEKAVRKPDEPLVDRTLFKMVADLAKCAFFEEEDVGTQEGAIFMAKVMRGSRYTSADIEGFSLFLCRVENDALSYRQKIGDFLSALVKNSPDSDFIIHTNHLSHHIDSLGSNNTKNIVVVGDVGTHVGIMARRGSITVHGSVGDDAGMNMRGGILTIDGDAGHCLGLGMKGGLINVKGNAGEHIGDDMEGGEIYVEGEIGSIVGDIVHGKIFHKGKLIVDK